MVVWGWGWGEGEGIYRPGTGEGLTGLWGIGTEQQGILWPMTVEMSSLSGLFTEEYSQRFVYVWVEGESRVRVKTVEVGSKGREGRECMDWTVQGKVVQIIMAGSRLALEIMDGKERRVDVIQSIQCYQEQLHGGRAMIRDDAMVMSARVDSGDSIEEIALYREYVIMSYSSGRIGTLSIIPGGKWTLQAVDYGCEDILRVGVWRERLIMICYKVEGLEVKAEIVWGSGRGREWMGGGNRVRLPGGKKWKDKREYLHWANGVKILTRPHGAGMVVIYGEMVYSLWEDKGGIGVEGVEVGQEGWEHWGMHGDKLLLWKQPGQGATVILPSGRGSASVNIHKGKGLGALSKGYCKHIQLMGMGEKVYAVGVCEGEGMVAGILITDQPFHTSFSRAWSFSLKYGYMITRILLAAGLLRILGGLGRLLWGRINRKSTEGVPNRGTLEERLQKHSLQRVQSLWKPSVPAN
jgi:hypothetical protein